VTATRDGPTAIDIRLGNPSQHFAFFERAEVTQTRDGDEILPIEYTDNYVTVFPGESVTLRAELPNAQVSGNWVRVGGYNTPPVVVPVR